MKACTKCELPKPETEFRLIWGRATPQRMAECIDCLRARQRAIYHRRQRQKAFAALPANTQDRELNRAAASWRGPVNRSPMRWAA
jgi:hypothetical protein